MRIAFFLASFSSVVGAVASVAMSMTTSTIRLEAPAMLPTLMRREGARAALTGAYGAVGAVRDGVIHVIAALPRHRRFLRLS